MKSQRATFRFLVLLALAAGAGACADSASGPLEPPRPSASLLGGTLQLVETTLSAPLTTVEATIGLLGGELAIPGGHSLRFPAGALLVPTTIRATAGGGTVEIEFGPHGLVFPLLARPTLTLSYADAQGVSDQDAAGLVLVYVDEAGQVQEVIETESDPAADVVRTRIGHFSTYILATD